MDDGFPIIKYFQFFTTQYTVLHCSIDIMTWDYFHFFHLCLYLPNPMFAKLMLRNFLHIHILILILTLPLISGSTWDIPPGTVFIGPNITARSQASFLPNIKDRDSTYVDFNTKLRTGLLTQFQYYIDTQGASGVSPVYVRFQVWEVLGTFFVAGVPSNYTVALRYEQRHLVDIATGVYTVSTMRQ